MIGDVRITAQEAKELSLEVWRYLAAHPEVDSKHKLPNDLLRKIIDMDSLCPLCELYKERPCYKCPLKTCDENSPYDKWRFTNNKAERQTAAQEIVEAIEAWEPEE